MNPEEKENLRVFCLFMHSTSDTGELSFSYKNGRTTFLRKRYKTKKTATTTTTTEGTTTITTPTTIMKAITTKILKMALLNFILLKKT